MIDWITWWVKDGAINPEGVEDFDALHLLPDEPGHTLVDCDCGKESNDFVTIHKQWN